MVDHRQNQCLVGCWYSSNEAFQPRKGRLLVGLRTTEPTSRQLCILSGRLYDLISTVCRIFNYIHDRRSIHASASQPGPWNRGLSHGHLGLVPSAGTTNQVGQWSGCRENHDVLQPRKQRCSSTYPGSSPGWVAILGICKIWYWRTRGVGRVSR